MVQPQLQHLMLQEFHCLQSLKTTPPSIEDWATVIQELLDGNYPFFVVTTTDTNDSTYSRAVPASCCVRTRSLISLLLWVRPSITSPPKGDTSGQARVIGFACAKPHLPHRKGYIYTVEQSIYIHRAHTGYVKQQAPPLTTSCMQNNLTARPL